MASVLVTGSSRGIGKATALALARAGHTVHATMRDPEGSPELAEAAREEELPIRVSRMDVTSDASVRERVERIHAEDGPLDALVNNAGLGIKGPIEALPLEAFRASMETNYLGAIRCIQAVLPGMRERGSGCIVNISSISGKISFAPFGPYTASKAALEALSEVLAQEVKPFGIRVAIVQPGIIDTAMARSVTENEAGTAYPHEARFADLFSAALQEPTPPSVVAETIVAIVEGEDGPLRYPAGPDAAPFLGWRASLSDEEWVAWGAADDDAWYEAVRRDFGIDARQA